MMKLKVNPLQNIRQIQKLSYHQRFELQVLEMSSSALHQLIQEELESNPFLEQDMQYETGHVQKEPSHFELLLNYVIKEKTLSEELHDQIRWYSDEIHTDLAYFIADMLDSNGYLNDSNQSLLKYFPQYSEKDVEDTIHIIQSMEPAGIAARSLSECLLLQLPKTDNETTRIAQEIILHYLPEVAAHHLTEISKTINASLESVQEAVDLIKQLNPKPGSQFSNTASYLYPDLFCYVEDQEICIELMNETFGLHTISFSDTLTDSEADCKNWTQRAHSLLSAIKKRNQTLLRVVSSICSCQKDYFLYSNGLKPCTMKQIATIANVHESTVSRCVADKSMIFNQQIIPLKYFFPKALADDSVNDILEMIRTLIKKEDPSHPISDEKISQQLAEFDYQVSRRTVAKYRETLRIPSSSKRKRVG